MFVQKVASCSQLGFVNLNGEFEEHVALMDQSTDSFWIHTAIIETSIEAAKARTRWTANDNVRLFLLDKAPRFGSVCCQQKIPAATVAVRAEVEGLTWCKVQLWQLGDLGCNSKRRIQLCNFGFGMLKLCAECQEELDNLIGLTAFCRAGAETEEGR